MRVVLIPNHSYTTTFRNQLKHCITEISSKNGSSKHNTCNGNSTTCNINSNTYNSNSDTYNDDRNNGNIVIATLAIAISIVISTLAMSIATMEIAIVATLAIAVFVVHAVDLASHTFRYLPNLRTYIPKLLSI